jgi:hypothetical protein
MDEHVNPSRQPRGQKNRLRPERVAEFRKKRGGRPRPPPESESRRKPDQSFSPASVKFFLDILHFLAPYRLTYFTLFVTFTTHSLTYLFHSVKFFFIFLSPFQLNTEHIKDSALFRRENNRRGKFHGEDKTALSPAEKKLNSL